MPSSLQQKTAFILYNQSSSVDTKINTKVDANASLVTFEGILKKNWDDHSFRLNTMAHLSSLGGELEAGRWSSEFDYDYRLDKRYAFNYTLGYKKEPLGRFRNQFYTGPSFGVTVIDRENARLDVKGNVLFDNDKLNEEQSDTYVSSRVGALYTWNVQDNLKFIQEEIYKVRLDENEKHVFYSKSAIESKITPKLVVGITYKVDYINVPSESLLNTNRTFLTSLKYKY